MSNTSNPITSDEKDVALVVDLDGTLCRTDTLHEALLKLILIDPASLVHLPVWLLKGRAALKRHVANLCIVDPHELPMNDAVIELVRAAKDSGRRTALVSAADHRQVTAVADALGIFSESHGTTTAQNLKGEKKAAFLDANFGTGRYDYVGDSQTDLPVWSSARKAITVQSSPALRKLAGKVNPNVHHIDPKGDLFHPIMKAMRPHQWSKNILLFLPLIAAHVFSPILSVFLGFLAFCFTASAVYVINDLVDLSADRAHPRKCKRPFASGTLSASWGAFLAVFLLLFAAAISIAIGNIYFLITLAVYLAATFTYSLILKRKLLVDVLALAGLYTIRIVAGGLVANVELSPWLLGFSMFLFLALAAVKRQAELIDQLESGRTSSGRAYEIDDVPILRGVAIAAGNASVLVLALYISSDDVQALYERPELLWAICPLLLYWILGMVMATHRGRMTDDPIVYAAKDRTSQTVIALSIVFASLAAIL